MENATKLTNRTNHLTILYIERNVSLRRETNLHLTKIFENILNTSNGEDALALYKKYKPDIVITDLNLADYNAFEMIVEMQEINPNVSIIVLSYKNSDFELLETLDLGIVALLEKPLHLTNLTRALQKVILLKPKKIKPLKKEKPIKITPTISKVIKKIPKKINKNVEPKKDIPSSNTVKKVVQEKIEPKKIQPPSARELIETAIDKKTTISCINNYKGITINYEGTIVQLQKNILIMQITKPQLIAVIYQKEIILNINKKYLRTKILDIDRKNNIVKLQIPYIIDYTQRDNKNKRISVDNSFKASIGYKKVHLELTPIDISYDYISLQTNEKVDIPKNTSIELTMGFEIDGPSSLVNEKKFTKIFATGTITRIEVLDEEQILIINHKIQKSGQSVFKKYLQQREIHIINEFKMRMKI